MRISDWSSDVCSSDLQQGEHAERTDCDDGQVAEEYPRPGPIVADRAAEDRAADRRGGRRHRPDREDDYGLLLREDAHNQYVRQRTPRAARKPLEHAKPHLDREAQRHAAKEGKNATRK